MSGTHENNKALAQLAKIETAPRLMPVALIGVFGCVIF